MCLFKPSCLMGAGLTSHRWGWSEVAGYGSDLIAPFVASWGRRSRVSGRPGSSPASVYTWCGVRLLLDSGRRQSCNHLQQKVRRERGGRLDCRDDRRLARQQRLQGRPQRADPPARRGTGRGWHPGQRGLPGLARQRGLSPGPDHRSGRRQRHLGGHDPERRPHRHLHPRRPALPLAGPFSPRRRCGSGRLEQAGDGAEQALGVEL